MAMCFDVVYQAGITCVTSLVLHLLLAEGMCLDPHRVQALGQPPSISLPVSGL